MAERMGVTRLVVRIDYVVADGPEDSRVVASRDILPQGIHEAVTQRDGKVWLLRAFDIDAGRPKDFAMRRIRGWYPRLVPAAEVGLRALPGMPPEEKSEKVRRRG